MSTKTIWHKEYSDEEIKALVKTENILDLLGIEFTQIGTDSITARMPVDKRTHQIHGILHGGATCVLAESVGSFASLMCIDLDKFYAVGSHISANHLRPVKQGFVFARATPVHLGRMKHVWAINVTSDNGKLIANCELTCAIIPARNS
jgi:1,4-dihydroxy-2-naphthoyl-CoA hydrolase